MTELKGERESGMPWLDGGRAGGGRAGGRAGGEQAGGWAGGERAGGRAASGWAASGRAEGRAAELDDRNKCRDIWTSPSQTFNRWTFSAT